MAYVASVRLWMCAYIYDDLQKTVVASHFWEMLIASGDKCALLMPDLNAQESAGVYVLCLVQLRHSCTVSGLSLSATCPRSSVIGEGVILCMSTLQSTDGTLAWTGATFCKKKVTELNFR